jgi:hypothetical protein
VTIGKTLVLVGLLLVLVGLALHASPSIPLLGRLPGDIRIERPGFRLYLPITTCLLLSLILSGVLHVLGRFR